MLISTAHVQVEEPGRYITRLCKHWGHRYKATHDEHQGHVDFGESSCELQAEKSVLIVRLRSPKSQISELENVVAEHLQRFVPKGGSALQFKWERSDSTGAKSSPEV